tara:strand:+ start:1206 stop:1493 length:288 start_codon:yes stop_codon:yes gene_type:complete
MFNLKAGNNETILTSERYTTKANAENGIESVRANSPYDGQYDRLTSTNNKPYFVLKATNGQVIGKSELYESVAGRDNGIESVKTNGPGSVVRDDT